MAMVLKTVFWSGWPMCASLFAEDRPVINAAEPQTNAIIASNSTERLTDEG